MEDTVLRQIILNGTQISFPVSFDHAAVHLPPRNPTGQSFPNNKHAMKYKTREEWEEVVRLYCEHIQRGKSDDSFPECDMTTFKRYREIYKSDIDTELITKAQRKRMDFWETIGINGTIGVPVTINGQKYGKFNAASWQFNMQNRFKWKSREDVTTNDKDIDTSPKVIIQTTDPRKHE